MPHTPLSIGVPAAGLARAQAERVARTITAAGVPFSVHLSIIADTGTALAGLHDDHIAESRSTMRNLHRLLLDGDIDVVIHRGFDLRGDVPDGLRIGAILPRGNPFDALVGPRDLSFDELPGDARVGVVQLRARVQLLEYRPDLHYELIAGDAGAWLTALIDERIDALVAPTAAIEHLALQERVSEIFTPELLIPAPGSGVLLCLCREHDERTASRLRPLHDRGTAIEYTAECAFMESMGASWEGAIAALARLQRDGLELIALVATPDGSRMLRERHDADPDDACQAGAELAALLLDQGAESILEGDEENAPCSDLAGFLPGSVTDIEWDETSPDD